MRPLLCVCSDYRLFFIGCGSFTTELKLKRNLRRLRPFIEGCFIVCQSGSEFFER